MAKQTPLTPAERLNRAHDRAVRLVAAIQRLNQDLDSVDISGLDDTYAKAVLLDVRRKLLNPAPFEIK